MTAGIAVRRGGRRQGNGRERQPRKARDEEQLIRVGSVVQRGRGLYPRDLGLCGREEHAERLRAVERAVAVGSVRQGDGVRAEAAVIFHDALAADALAQLRHGVCGVDGAVQHRQEERQAALLRQAAQRRNVARGRDGQIGVCHLPEIVKVGAAGIGREIEHTWLHAHRRSIAARMRAAVRSLPSSCMTV